MRCRNFSHITTIFCNFRVARARPDTRFVCIFAGRNTCRNFFVLRARAQRKRTKSARKTTRKSFRNRSGDPLASSTSLSASSSTRRTALSGDVGGVLRASFALDGCFRAGRSGRGAVDADAPPSSPRNDRSLDKPVRVDPAPSLATENPDKAEVRLDSWPCHLARTAGWSSRRRAAWAA